MSIFISSALVVSSQGGVLDAPVMCFDNIVTPNNITSTSGLIDRPIGNVANPATAWVWEASSAVTQTITITTDGREVDYVGIARHNLDQIGLTVTIKYNGVIVAPAQAVSDTQALLFLQNIATPTTIQIIITGATVAPRIGVLYVGKSLQLQRGIGVGHTPITYGRNRKTINGVSENGQYLGEIVVSQVNSNQVNMQNLTPDWYRSMLDPYFAASPRVPCFFAWKPSKYATEVGYVWVEGDPQPTNQRSNGMMSVSWTFKGLA